MKPFRRFIEFLKKLFLIEKIDKEVINEEKKNDYNVTQIKEKKNYPHNYLKFPNNIFEPEKRNILGDEYTFYEARFNDLYELYDYLKSDPPVNKEVFKKLSSVTNSSFFAGKSYEKAVEDLVSDVDPGYEEFLTLQRDLNNARRVSVDEFRTVKTVAGGRIDSLAYIKGDPYCYETEERVKKPRFIKIFVTLSYSGSTSEEAVLHRAVIITNILKALEMAGYSIDLKTFELSEYGSEVVHLEVNVKRFGEMLNMQALYKSLCSVEFLRRILFRLLETLDVKDNWSIGYGRVTSEKFARAALDIDEYDLYFDQPSNMGIFGEDLGQDFERAITHLKLQDKIDVEKAKEEFNQATLTLNLKKNY